VARLEQVRGVGTLIALTYLLALEGPHRFRKSPNVGCYVVLQLVTSSASKARREIWFRPEKNSPERFYVRHGPSSTELSPRDAVDR
jgi:hypothetical protein